jgi:MarR family transcriptional regulator, organic hydroperoxide resistance regulator
MNKDEQLKLDNQLCFAAYACSKEIIKLYRPHLEKLGLTYTQYITMLVLWEFQTLSAKELGDKLYLDSGTLTPLLKKLEQMGWVERRRSTVDERSLTVTLTDQGRALKEAAGVIPEQMVCGLRTSLEEIVALREQLKTLFARIHSEER